MDNFLATKTENLDKIDGIGEVVASSLSQWLNVKSNYEMVNSLLDAGVVVLRQKPRPKGRFSGTSWVFTGTLQEFSREEAATKVKNLGAEVSSTVSQKTTYVVAGEDPGSKYDKAKSIGVNVMNEQEFMKILKS